MDKRFELAFDVVEYTADQVLRMGDVTATLAELRHVATCVGIRLEADGRPLVDSGDTGVTDALAELATNAGPTGREHPGRDRSRPPRTHELRRRRQERRGGPDHGQPHPRGRLVVLPAFPVR